MATDTHTRRFVVLLLLLAAGLCAPAPSRAEPEAPLGALATLLSAEDNGRDEREAPSIRPTVQAAFALESYAPGQSARLVFFSPASRVSLQIVHAGTETRLHPAGT